MYNVLYRQTTQIEEERRKTKKTKVTTGTRVDALPPLAQTQTESQALKRTEPALALIR